MHLRNFPRRFTKDGKTRLVYYSAEARDLKALGWEEDNGKKATTSNQGKITAELTKISKAEEPVKPAQVPDFSVLTRAELLEYAEAHGVDLPNNALKAELVEACKAL